MIRIPKLVAKFWREVKNGSAPHGSVDMFHLDDEGGSTVFSLGVSFRDGYDHDRADQTAKEFTKRVNDWPAQHAAGLRAAILLDEMAGLLGGEPPESAVGNNILTRISLSQDDLRNGTSPRPPTGNELAIGMYMHCGLCIAEVTQMAADAGSASPRDHARLSIGWTKQGLQVWCVRHDCNVLHVDFEGCTHPADTTRKAAP